MGSLKLITILEKTYPTLEKEVEQPTHQEINILNNNVSDIMSDIKKIKKDLEDLGDDFEDDVSRMDYVRQISGEFLEYLNTLDTELQGQVKTPESNELMNKIMGRSERKKYYMSKFRL